MIEIVYKEEKQEARGNEGYFRLPKNIRQIGDCKGKQKIYLEDYVYTYLKKLSADSSSGKAAILLGQYNWADGTAYFFLRGALEITCIEVSPDNLKFDEKVWKEVGDTMNRYFKDQSILGWFLSLPGELEENDERILKTHLNHFGGNDKVLFRIDPGEKEEAFYIYDNGALKKLGGFYIYYEKNEAMQNYMVDHSQSARVENVEQVADQAVSDFRKIVSQKQEQQKKKSGGKGVTYGIAVCAAAVVLAVGLNYVTKKPEADNGQTVQTNSSAVAANADTFDDNSQNSETNSSSSTTEKQADRQTETESAGTLSESGKNAGGDSTESGSGTVSETSENTEENNTDPAETSQTVSDSGEDSQQSGSGQTGTDPATETSANVLTEYTVQKGDSLSRISEKYYGTMNRVKDICAMNGITSEDVIYAGQKILLPK